MKRYHLTAYIEKDRETGLYFGHVPHLRGIHMQGETLDELRANLEEVTLCLEELSAEEKEALNFKFGRRAPQTYKVSI